MNTYTWNCATVDAHPSHTDENGVAKTNVIYNVHWRLTGTDGTNSETVIGTQTIAIDDLGTFTEFETLTNDAVAAWVETAIGEERVAELKASLDKSLEEKANPTSVTLTIGGTETTPPPAPEVE